MSSAPGPSVEEKNKQMGKLFVFVIVAMFLFGFVSIPLYRIICDAIDPGGSAGGLKSQLSCLLTFVAMLTVIVRDVSVLTPS